ncbi:MAG: hypothetical protein ACJ78K_01625, partial [Gemmatimonadaceae bacterium]
AMQPKSYYDNEQQQPIASRTHYRAANGALHSFGGWRAANEGDPPPLAEELAAGKEHVQYVLEERKRDSVNAEHWRRQQDSIWGKKPR